MSSINRQKNSIHVGSSLILVTFVLLCLVTFSILALTSAKADYAMTKETGDNTTDYYNATNIAEEKLVNIADTLYACLEESRSIPSFYNSITKAFDYDDSITVSRNEADIHIQFVVPINGSRSLQVSLSTAYPVDKESFSFQIDSYKSVGIPLIDDEIYIDDTRFLF